MSLQLLVWALVLLGVIFSLLFAQPIVAKTNIPLLFVLVLIIILGWRVFGPAIHQ